MKGATEPASKGKRWGISKLKVFLIALSYAYMIKGMSGAYSKNIITQLERRFRISASLAGLIDASFEIGNLLVIAFVSYFGAKLHRPRMLAVGCLVMGLGCCLSSLPHLLMERYHYEKAFTPSENSSSMALCMANESQWNVPEAEECGNEVESLMWVYVLMGNILRGVGETPIAPLGLSYLDDFAKQENSPLYIGIVHTVEVAGPLIGSLLAAFCAQLYVDFPSTDLADVTLEKNDARWVGAWWLGYLINASVTLLAAVPFCFLPKSLPKEGEEDKPKSLETTKGHKERHVPRSQQSIAKDFLPCLKGLFCNPVYVLFLVITVMQFNAYTGMLTFVPKYVEVMYGKSASEAIFLLAVYNIPVIGVGYFLGGLLMKKFKISTFYAANISFWTSVLDYSLFFFLAFVFVCKNSTLAGITVAYDSTPQISNTDLLQSECNVDCSCPTTIWDPVCGDNGLTYASACLAGCDSSTWTRKQFVLSNCSCIEASGLPFINASAVSGSCPREGACDTMLQSFLIMSLVTCLIYAVGGMPGYMVLIRNLKPEEKSLGLGLHLLAARSLGSIPSPIYYGALIDTTCLKWETTRCGEPGACRIYDTYAFQLVYLVLSALIRAAAYVPCVVLIILLKKRESHDGDKADINEEKNMVTERNTKDALNMDEMQELKPLPEE